MSFMNKFIASGLTLGLAMCLTAASYAEPAKEIEKTSDADAILFRIENIKPMANEDGMTDKCSFLVTVYNRMDKKVEKIDMDFRWLDTISKKYQIVGDEVKVVSNMRDAETYIYKHVDLENIFPHQQKSFEQIVSTDKCYLLLDQLDYKVNNCVAEGDKIRMQDNRPMNSGSCINRFNYINSKNPEYYSEFKDVPDSVLEQQAEEAKQHELSDVEKSYNQAMENLGKVHEELDKIVKMPEENADKKDEGAEDKDKSDDKDKAENKADDKEKTDAKSEKSDKK